MRLMWVNNAVPGCARVAVRVRLQGTAGDWAGFGLIGLEVRVRDGVTVGGAEARRRASSNLRDCSMKMRSPARKERRKPPAAPAAAPPRSSRSSRATTCVTIEQRALVSAGVGLGKGLG